MLDHSLQAIRNILMPNAHFLVVSYDYSIGLVVPPPPCPGLPHTPIITVVAALVGGSGVVAGEAGGDGAGVLFVDVVGGGLEMAGVVKVVAWEGLPVGVGGPGVPTGVAEPNIKV